MADVADSVERGEESGEGLPARLGNRGFQARVEGGFGLMCLTTLSIESAPSTWQQDSCPLPRCHGTSTSYQRPLQLIERLFVVSGKNQPCVAHCTHDPAFCKISTYQHDHLCDVVCSEVHCTAVPQHHTRLLQRAAQLIRLLRILRRPTVTGRQVKREYELLRCCMDRSPLGFTHCKPGLTRTWRGLQSR